MNPLSLLYGAVSGARNLIYDTGWFTSRLQGPVVSVGNISVGGTGKTPFIIYLGELLNQRGIKFDALSRGYGRASTGVRVVDAAGSAREFGDEPLLIARKLGIPVIVGESRYHAGLVAEQTFGPQLHLLDDGFQHRQLHRDLDIVLLGEGDLEDKLLPAGRLREGVASLSRADVAIVEAGVTFSREEVRTGETPVPTCFKMDRKMLMDAERAASYIAFCGIARPHEFFAGLRAAGVNVVGERAFRDHHVYSDNDVEELQRMWASAGAQGFVTTEKDEINLGDFAGKLSRLSVARLNVSLDRPEELMEAVEKAAGEANAAKS
jgi:tetraacyldisaccharide 4'-kinase